MRTALASVVVAAAGILLALAANLGGPASAEEEPKFDGPHAALLREFVGKTIRYAETDPGRAAEFEAARTAAHETREKLAAVGEAIIPEMLPLLRHDQVNVRRGTAIVLGDVAVAARLWDRELFTHLMGRIVEEEDVGCRHNLRLVVETLVGHLADVRTAVK